MIYLISESSRKFYDQLVGLFFGLILIFTIYSSAWCQDSLDYQNIALDKIQIHFSIQEIPRIPDLIDKYRYQRLSNLTVNKIRNDLMASLSQDGYYLASLDSFKIQTDPAQDRGIIHIYITPGLRFVLNDVIWSSVDTLSNCYNDIQEITQNYINKPFNDLIQKDLYKSVLKIFENSGYPLCSINTIGFKLDSLNHLQMGIELQVDIRPGPFVKITGLKLPEDSDINMKYLERNFRYKKNEIYNEERIARYTRILKRLDFLTNVKYPTLVMEEDSLFYLQLDYQEAPSTTFDGIIGYIPPPVNDPTQSGYFTGLINVNLKNLFTTGRRLSVYWQKPNQLSEEIRINYREPFLLGLPFHIGGSLNRLIRDTTYIEWRYTLDAEFPFNENLTGIARFYKREVFPDSLASAVSRIPQTEAFHTELGIRWDTRDDFYNPRTGLFLTTLFDYGTQQNVGPDYLIKEDSLIEKTNVIKMTSDLGIFIPMWSNQVLAFNFHTVLIGYQGQEVQIPDMFWFGGATTVRGYRENQFYGEKAAWLNSEYRFLLGPQSRFFVFTDLAYYNRNIPEFKEEYLVGYGMGIRIPSPLGVMQVDYGLAKGLVFREGKLHFRLINEF
jgi:outer membrane protein assembly factor BamA